MYFVVSRSMALVRSGDADSLIVRNKFAENALPTNRNTVEYSYFFTFSSFIITQIQSF